MTTRNTNSDRIPSAYEQIYLPFFATRKKELFSLGHPYKHQWIYEYNSYYLQYLYVLNIFMGQHVTPCQFKAM
jgi:hypothetical protein